MHTALRSLTAQFRKTASLVADMTIPSDSAPLDRFRLICDRERIDVIDDTPLSIRGALMRRGTKQDVIVLDSRLGLEEREFVAFHELGHYFLGHHGDARDCDDAEFQANFFAFLALRAGGGR